jgi:hypothetical protein
MTESFTVQDVLGILRVFPYFSLVLFVPGYLVGAAFDLLGFRKRGVSERILMALVFSCAVSPYLINELCWYVSIRTACIVYVLLGVVFVASVFLEWSRHGYAIRVATHWTTKAALCVLAIWLVVCLASLSDIQIGQRLYSTTATYDHSVRSAFIASALRTGAPPANPFFYPGYLVKAHYYYYWNVLCALPAYMSGASTRIVLYASCVWSGLLLAAIIPIYPKHFLEKVSRLRIATLFGFALIGITGLDLIPTLIKLTPHNSIPAIDMEWWDPVQVTSWMDSLLWVPHHVASLVACLVAFLLLWKAVSEKERWTQVALLVLSAAGFASAAGLSIYVMITFSIFIATWVVYLLVQGKIFAASLHVAVGLLALLLSAGYLSSLRGSESGSANGSTFLLRLSLRPLPVDLHLLALYLGHHHRMTTFLLQILFGVIVLFLELGIYFAVGLLQAKQDWKQWRQTSEAQRALWFMAASALLVMIFVRSTAIATNDLGHRSALVLQFVLLLWTAMYLAEKGLAIRNLLSATLVGLIILGGASSLYQLVMLRAYPILAERHGWKSDSMMGTGREVFLVRNAYAQLDRITSPDAIVQYNPESDLRLQMLIYSRYQQVDANFPNCSTAFGGPLAVCHDLQDRLKTIYSPIPTDNPTIADVEHTCDALHIQALVVNGHDPIWSRTDSWMLQQTPIIQNDFVRIYRCDGNL